MPNGNEPPQENSSQSQAAHIVLQHISAEIRDEMEHASALRNRVVFSAWVGPLVAIGVIVSARGGSFPTLEGLTTIGCFSGACLLYVILGAFLGAIENRCHKRCNCLRYRLIKLSKETVMTGWKSEIPSSYLCYYTPAQDSKLRAVHIGPIYIGHIAAYLLMFVCIAIIAAVCVFALSNLTNQEPCFVVDSIVSRLPTISMQLSV